jgi:hypothetical protein
VNSVNSAVIERRELVELSLCRGAISDFHAFKAKIVEADCDQICFRINEDDIFGDGNNFQVRPHAATMLRTAATIPPGVILRGGGNCSDGV